MGARKFLHLGNVGKAAYAPKIPVLIVAKIDGAPVLRQNGIAGGKGVFAKGITHTVLVDGKAIAYIVHQARAVIYPLIDGVYGEDITGGIEVFHNTASFFFII